MDQGIEKHDVTKPVDVYKAHGRPGNKPSWSFGAKTMVGTAASPQSHMWYTVANGTLNEIYFPDVDQANTRSVRFIVSDGVGFFSDEQWDASHTVQWIEPGIPGCHTESRCKAERYTIIKDIITDPVRDTLMMRVSFTTSESQSALKLFLFVEPQMGDLGANNDAWVGHYKGLEMLFSQRNRAFLTVACSHPIHQASCGYMGKSDGLTALSKQEELPKANLAEKGNVALTGEIDYQNSGGTFTISIACGTDPAEAAQQARAGLLEEFDKTRTLFAEQWRKRQSEYREIADLSGHE